MSESSSRLPSRKDEIVTEQPAPAACPECGWEFLPDEPRDCPACKIGVTL